jgi:hypothetical protein
MKLKDQGDQFCMDFGLSPEVLDMGEMMIGQFVAFVADAGYDGADLGSEDEYKHISPVAPKSEVDALVRVAIAAGCQPFMSTLYRNPNRSMSPIPSWITSAQNCDGSGDCVQSEVQPFRGSCNFDVPNPPRDGDWWMAFSDSMKFGGKSSSVMDSSLIMSNTALLTCNALSYNSRDHEIYFDAWWAKTSPNEVDRLKNLLQLRREFLPGMAKALEERDLSVFPQQLVSRIAAFAMEPPITLNDLEPAQKDVADAVQAQHLNQYTWKADEGPVDDDPLLH